MFSMKAVAAIAFIISLDKLLVADWIPALSAHETALVIRFVLVSYFLLTVKLLTAFFASFGRCNAAARMADQFVVFEGKTFSQLLTKLNVIDLYQEKPGV